MKFKEYLTESADLNELKDAFYKRSDGMYACMDDAIPELEKMSDEQAKKLGVNPKEEIKIIKDMMKLHQKSKLGSKL